MQQYRKNLGKVSLTAEGVHKNTNNYDILSIVYDEHTQHGFISRKEVPVGVDLYNAEYWMPLNVSGYADNNMIILSKKTSDSEIQSYTLEEAVKSVASVGRRPGAILGFYNENTDRLDIGGRWELWQYNGIDVADWENLNSWDSIYYNYNKFAGWYRSEDALKKYVPFPEIGCYAYVGSDLNEAVIYRCDRKYAWTNTIEHVWNYFKMIVGGNVTVGENGNWFNNGVDTNIPASVKGENGKTPIIRNNDNVLELSYDNVNWKPISDEVAVWARVNNNKLEITKHKIGGWEVVSDYIAAWFRWQSDGGQQTNSIGKIQITRDGITWTDLSGEFSNNLRISKYIGADESLPTSGIAEGTIYAKGPYYEDDDTLHEYPAYRLWVYAWKGNTLAWIDNGEFQSIAAGIVQETGDGEGVVMSQKAVTEKLSELGSEVDNNIEKNNLHNVLEFENNTLNDLGIILYSSKRVLTKGFLRPPFEITASDGFLIRSISKFIERNGVFVFSGNDSINANSTSKITNKNFVYKIVGNKVDDTVDISTDEAFQAFSCKGMISYMNEKFDLTNESLNAVSREQQLQDKRTENVLKISHLNLCDTNDMLLLENKTINENGIESDSSKRVTSRGYISAPFIIKTENDGYKIKNIAKYVISDGMEIVFDSLQKIESYTTSIIKDAKYIYRIIFSKQTDSEDVSVEEVANILNVKGASSFMNERISSIEKSNVDNQGIIDKVNNLIADGTSNKIEIVKQTIEGKSYKFGFIPDRVYKVTNNSNVHVKVLTRLEEDGEQIELIAESLNALSTIYFTPKKYANYIRLGQTTSSISILVEDVDTNEIVRNIGINDIRWEIGGIQNSGIEDDKTYRIRTSDFIWMEKGSLIKADDGYSVILWQFSKPYFVGKILNVDSGNGGTIELDKNCYVKMELREVGNTSELNDCSLVTHFTILGKTNSIKKIKNDRNRLSLSRVITSPVSEKYLGENDFVPINVSSNNLERFYRLWDSLQENYSDNVSSQVIGIDSSGLYDIRAYTIKSFAGTNSITGYPNPLKIIWIGNIHGIERAAAIDDYVFFKALLENHNEDETLEYLWENVEFIVIPTMNPWGFENAARYNYNRVNLNRNFPSDWEYIADSEEGNYSGEYASSEIETKTIMSFLSRNQDAFMVFNRHTSGSWSDAVRYGYLSSRYKTDNDVAVGVCREIDVLWKKLFQWIKSDVEENKYRAVISTSPVQNRGTLDGYYNDNGFHGFLFELGNGETAGDKYPNSNAQDLQRMDVIAQAIILRAMVQQNQYILSDSSYTDYSLL